MANHNTPIGTVSVINTTDNATCTINVGIKPCGVAITSDGTKVYVTNSGSNTVSVIDTTTNEVIDTVEVGIRPSGLGQFIGSVPGYKAETMTTLTYSPNQSPVEKQIMLIATVNTTSQGTEKPSGTVTFIEGATPIGTKTLSDGQAILDTSSLPNGSHIIARYKGNNKFRPSTSSSFTLKFPEPTDPKTENSNNYINALIGAIAVIIAAVIGFYGKRK